MKNSQPVLSLYKQYKEEQQNYRLKLDLKRHNWLLYKLKTTDAKPTKREKAFLKRIKKNMQDKSEQFVNPEMAQKRPMIPDNNVNNIPNKLQKITNTDKTGTESSSSLSMPDIIDLTTTDGRVNAEPDYQVEPLALLHKTKLNKTENSSSNSEIVNNITLVHESKKEQSSVENKSTSAIVNIEEKDPKPIFLGVPSSKPKSWFDIKEQISCKHNLPLSVAPQMEKYRIPRQPANVNQKLYINRELQTDSHEDMEMLNFLHTHDITTVEKLKDIVESLNEENSKILEFLKTKGISFQMLNKIICDHDKKNNNEDEGKLKKEVENEVNDVSPEIVESVVALSDQNKKFLNLCAPKVILARIANLNELAKNKLEEVERAPTKQSVIVQQPVNTTDTATNKQIEIPSLQHKNSLNIYQATGNEEMGENYGNLVIDNQMLEDKSHQGLVDIGGSAIDTDTPPQVIEDIVGHIVKDTGYQVAEDSGSQIAENNSYNLAEMPAMQNTGFQTKEESSSLVLQEAKKQVAIPTIRGLSTRRDRPQIGAEKNPPENKRPYLLRDTRRPRNRSQASMKTQNSNQDCPHVSAGFYLPISTHNNTFNNSTAGHVNRNVGYNSNNDIVSYHACGQNDSRMVYGINSQCGHNNASGLNSIYDHNNNVYRNQNSRNIANNNSQNYNIVGYGSNAQYGNNAAYYQHKQNTAIRRHGSRNHNNNVIYGQNNNVTYNPNSQNNNVTYNPNNQNDNGIFNSSTQNSMSGGHATESFVHRSVSANTVENPTLPNVQNNNNDTRGSMAQNNFWGSAGQSLPLINPVGPPSQWPATSMNNLAIVTDIAQSQNTQIYPISSQSTIVETESVWYSQRWSAM